MGQDGDGAGGARQRKAHHPCLGVPTMESVLAAARSQHVPWRGGGGGGGGGDDEVKSVRQHLG